MKGKIFACAVICVAFALALTGCKAAQSIAFDKDAYRCGIGEKFEPKVRIRPKKAKFELKCENELLATVEGGRAVRCARSGITKITATAGKKTATATLIISDATKAELAELGPETEILSVRYRLTNAAEVATPDGFGVPEDIGIRHYARDSFMYDPPPELAGYELDGWYLDSACVKPLDMRNLPDAPLLELYCRAEQRPNGFLAEESDGEWLVSGLTYPHLPHSALTLPERVEAKNVSGIAKSAFKNDRQMTEIFIPASYESIGDGAFEGCARLEKVRFGEGSRLKRVGMFAFGGDDRDKKPEKEPDPIGTESLKELESLLSGAASDDGFAPEAWAATDLFDLPEKLQETLDEIRGEKKPEPEPEPESEEKKISGDSPCGALKTIEGMPPTAEIGEFAFLGCRSLSLPHLKPETKTIRSGAFANTAIETVDLSAVEEIGAYAFYGCEKLSLVTGAENATRCGANAFLETAVYASGFMKDPVVYVDTILVGIATAYERSLGGRRHEIREDATLIADNAFAAPAHSDLTLYFPKRKNGKGIIVGTYAAQDAQGVCLAAACDEDCEAYMAEAAECANGLTNRFCARRDIQCLDDPDAANYGTHRLLKFARENESDEYFYDLFEPGEIVAVDKDGNKERKRKTPVEIDLAKLEEDNGIRITRIDTRALNLLVEWKEGKKTKSAGGNLERLTMPKHLLNVAIFSVVNCYRLKTIDLTQCVDIPNIRQGSFQFSGLGCGDSERDPSPTELLIRPGLRDKYAEKWNDAGEAKSRLKEAES